VDINQKSLLVVDSPYLLYVFSSIECDEVIDIFVCLGTNYSLNEYEKFINYILPVNKVGKITYFEGDFNWNIKRNSSTIDSVIKELEDRGINENFLYSYSNIYLNSYSSAICFYLSTVRPYIAIQHSTFDILRHFPFKYFVESIKFFLRTKKIRSRYLQYCMTSTLESMPTRFLTNFPFSNLELSERFYQSYNLIKTLSFQNKDIGVLLWTNHYSYDDSFNVKFINLNLSIFGAAYKSYNNNLDYLILKFHHRIPRPNKIQNARIKSAFKRVGINVILFDEIFNYDSSCRIYPIEMFLDIFNISFFVGACSSGIWNASEKLTCRTYSAFQYENSLVGRLKFVISGHKNINKKLKYIPIDLSANINESN